MLLISSSSYGGLQRPVAALVIAFSSLFLFLLHRYFLRPASLRRALLQQGLTVLPYRPIFGSLPQLTRLEAAAQLSDMTSPSDHHLTPRILPFYHSVFSKLSVDTFVFWTGTTPTLVAANPDYAKSLMSADYRHTVKPASVIHSFHGLLGNGLLLANGEDWHNQRNILRPAFFSDKLKHMVAEMANSALEMVRSWEQEVIKQGGQSAEIEVAHDLKNATADILARTSFGSSYDQGKSVFDKQVKLLYLLSDLRVQNSVIPGYRFLPTAANRECMKLEKSINKVLRQIVESRRQSMVEGEGISHETDMLGLMLAAQNEDPKSKVASLTTQQVIDDCKTFFFAGHETTANLLAWTMMLLSLSLDWQERAREEVLEICGGKEEELKAEQLNKLRILGNILNESLRLYPPVPEYGRRLIVSKDKHFDLGQISLPPGVSFTIPTLLLHRNKDLWGTDADEFRPERFNDGIGKACKHPYAFQPFGMGPRICIGQTFAIMEAKVLMAAILQRFKFELSPNYKHAPERAITMRPKHGIPIILHRI